MSEQDSSRLIVDFVADPVCPWCYVGLQALKRCVLTLRDHEGLNVVVRFRPYLLSPNTPKEGVDRARYYAQKFPDEARLTAMREALTNAAAQMNVAFDPSKPSWLPNTVNAHRVLRWAHFEGLHEVVAEQLYEAFWKQDANIGTAQTLADIATQAGLDGEKVRADLASEKDTDEILAEASALSQAGVAGVPTFIVNERKGFSGALPPHDLLENIKAAAGLKAA